MTDNSQSAIDGSETIQIMRALERQQSQEISKAVSRLKRTITKSSLSHETTDIALDSSSEIDSDSSYQENYSTGVPRSSLRVTRNSGSTPSLRVRRRNVSCFSRQNKKSIDDSCDSVVSEEQETLVKNIIQTNVLSESYLFKTQMVARIRANSLADTRTLLREKEFMDPAKYNERLLTKFQNTLLDSWRLQLFRRYLQQQHVVILLDLHLDMQNFYTATQQTSLTTSLKQILQTAYTIFHQYEEDFSVPSQIRTIFKTHTLPFLEFLRQTLDDPDDLTFEMETNSSEDDISRESDWEGVFPEFNLANYELSSSDLETLGSDDPKLFSKPFSEVQETIQNLPGSPMQLVSWLFWIFQQITTRIFLKHLFPSFLCSHDQAYTLLHYSSSSQLEDSTDSETQRSVSEPETGSSEDSIVKNPYQTHDSPENIVKMYTNSGEMIIHAITIEKCIQYLIEPTKYLTGLKFYWALVIGYQYFVTYDQLISQISQALEHLFTENRPTTLSPESPLRRIVCQTLSQIGNFITHVLEYHEASFHKNPTYYQLTQDLVSKYLSVLMHDYAENLIMIIHSYKNSTVVKNSVKSQEKPPKQRMHKKLSVVPLNKITITMIDAVEFARQITYRDNRTLRMINVEEYLHMNWSRADKESLAPNLLESIHQFCNLGFWVASEIVREPELPKRAYILKRCIAVAYECFRLKNFNGAMAIVSGLQNHCIYRLKNTWDELPEKSWDKWEELCSLFKCDQNFQTLREVTSCSDLPCIPYLGM